MRHRAFTLVELLVSLLIIALLVALFLPTLKVVRRSAQAVACLSNQRQLMLGILAYTTEHRGVLPYSLCDGRFYPYTDRLGQYLGITSPGSGALSTWGGNWKVLRCGANSQSPQGLAYGLNHYFCADATFPSNPPALPGDPNIINTPKQLLSFTRTSLIVVAADISGDGRMYTQYNPLVQFGYGNVDQLATWAASGWPQLQPFVPVQRHRGGTNCAFLDGHVRWSPNMKVEDQAGTLYLRDNSNVH